MEVPSRENSTFDINEVSRLITQTVENIIGTSTYQQKEINHWIANIVDRLLTDLTNLDKPFKYIVQAMVMQNNGAGLHVASSCYWNNQTDGSCTVRWSNNHLYTIVSVFGLAI